MISTAAFRRTAPFFRQAAAALALIAATIQMTPAAAQAPSNADLVATIESVVRTDSQAWWVNTYDRGSIYAPRVTWTNPDGRGFVLRANYTYNGGASGYVDLSVYDGRVSCLQYWDSSGCNAMRTRPAPWAELMLAGLALAITGAATNDSSTGTRYENSGGGRRMCPGYTGPDGIPVYVPC